jgi:hypothetical protein
MMPGELTRGFSNKYDLMHLNTPSFASSVVTWDTSKLTPITKNRVIKAFKDGFIKFSSGDAASMYMELRKRFGIPEFTLNEPTKTKSGHLTGGYISWGVESAEMTALLQPVYHAERVARRLEGNYVPWYLQADELALDRTWFHYSLEHDMSEVKAYIDRTMASPEIKERREEAIQFIEAGGKLTFTWRQ